MEKMKMIALQNNNTVSALPDRSEAKAGFGFNVSSCGVLRSFEL